MDLVAGVTERSELRGEQLSVEAEREEQEALTAVMAEILNSAHEPATSEELERSLRAVRSDTLYSLETMEGQAGMLGHYALLGDYALAGTYLE